KQGEKRLLDVTTYAYSAPERFHPDNPFIDANDIFSFGITLGHMITQELPWPDSNNRDDIQKYLDMGLQPPFNNKKIPVNIKELMMHCLWQKPQDRYTSVEIDYHIEHQFKAQC